MAYQEDEQVKLKRQRSKQAIALAMQGRWKEAVVTNRAILEGFPSEIDALNRLGKAYMELGDYEQARQAYERAIKFDSYNAIAKKNLRHLSQLSGTSGNPDARSPKVDPRHFIEEIGKSGVVHLTSLAPAGVRAKMVPGDQVYLKVNGANLLVEDGRGEYLGLVDPKHALRLVRLMDGGNKYSAAVVSANEERMTVIIREIYQDPSQAGRPSFPSKKIEGMRPYVSERLVRRELGYGEEEEEEEPGYSMAREEEEPLFEGLSGLEEQGEGEE